MVESSVAAIKLQNTGGSSQSWQHGQQSLEPPQVTSSKVFLVWTAGILFNFNLYLCIRIHLRYGYKPVLRIRIQIQYLLTWLIKKFKHFPHTQKCDKMWQNVKKSRQLFCNFKSVYCFKRKHTLFRVRTFSKVGSRSGQSRSGGAMQHWKKNPAEDRFLYQHQCCQTTPRLFWRIWNRIKILKWPVFLIIS